MICSKPVMMLFLTVVPVKWVGVCVAGGQDISVSVILIVGFQHLRLYHKVNVISS